jgi:hypothetical protein
LRTIPVKIVITQDPESAASVTALAKSRTSLRLLPRHLWERAKIAKNAGGAEIVQAVEEKAGSKSAVMPNYAKINPRFSQARGARQSRPFAGREKCVIL